MANAKRKKKPETDNERIHGHCADVLIDDYGVPKKLRPEVCDEIAKIWKQNTMIHCTIIHCVRGFQSSGLVFSLRSFLSSNQTHSPKNHKTW